jgi:hypothetical protein
MEGWIKRALYDISMLKRVHGVIAIELVERGYACFNRHNENLVLTNLGFKEFYRACAEMASGRINIT